MLVKYKIYIFYINLTSLGQYIHPMSLCVVEQSLQVLQFNPESQTAPGLRCLWPGCLLKKKVAQSSLVT